MGVEGNSSGQDRDAATPPAGRAPADARPAAGWAAGVAALSLFLAFTLGMVVAGAMGNPEPSQDSKAPLDKSPSSMGSKSLSGK